jgi:hypothetical protein
VVRPPQGRGYGDIAGVDWENKKKRSHFGTTLLFGRNIILRATREHDVPWEHSGSAGGFTKKGGIKTKVVRITMRGVLGECVYSVGTPPKHLRSRGKHLDVVHRKSANRPKERNHKDSGLFISTSSFLHLGGGTTQDLYYKHKPSTQFFAAAEKAFFFREI